MLTKEERERYCRQIAIPEVGEEGQEKLKKAKVFIAGSGGLGSPVAIYLAAAGVGTIRIADHDRVELSNLNRQVLHWEEDIGRKKVDSALEKLQKLNRSVKLETASEVITEANVHEVINGFDLIVDALDNLPTRYILNKAAIAGNLPLFHGAVYGFEGRVTTVIPGQTACLMCLYRGIPGAGCPRVIGVAPEIIGGIQAMEVIKYITGTGKLLTNRLLSFNGLDMKFSEFNIKRNPDCEHCGHLPGGSRK